MKTPREILLEQHRQADRQLAQIQTRVLSRPKFSEWPFLVLRKLWFELVFPLRVTWCALAAVWLVLMIANLEMNDTHPMTMTKTETAAMQVAWKERQQILDGTFASIRVPADRPRLVPPKPQSRRALIIAIG